MSVEALSWSLAQAPSVQPQCVAAPVGLANHAGVLVRGVDVLGVVYVPAGCHLRSCRGAMELAKEVVPARDKVGLNPPNLADCGPGSRPGALPFEEEPSRCAAAHSDDVRQCEGQRNAVQIIDRTGASVAGCVLHGAVLLASLEGGRVAPLNGPDGAAIEAFAGRRWCRRSI